MTASDHLSIDQFKMEVGPGHAALYHPVTKKEHAGLLWEPSNGEILTADVWSPSDRRRGFATHLLNHARKYAAENGMARPEHSTALTDEGRGWAGATG